MLKLEWHKDGWETYCEINLCIADELVVNSSSANLYHENCTK